jgi:anti-sigma B factor antagonist
MTRESFSFEPAADAAVVARVGESLDFRNAALFKEACFRQVDAGFRFFILDFSRTRFLDSTGLASIFSLYKRLAPQQGRVVFASPHGHVQHTIQVTGIHRIFPQCLAAALPVMPPAIH